MHFTELKCFMFFYLTYTSFSALWFYFIDDIYLFSQSMFLAYVSCILMSDGVCVLQESHMLEPVDRE